MNKKQYQQPRMTTVVIGLNKHIMESMIIGSSSTTTVTQFSRKRNNNWGEEEEDQ